jgi:enterochelin esterase-like enzyme
MSDSTLVSLSLPVFRREGGGRLSRCLLALALSLPTSLALAAQGVPAGRGGGAAPLPSIETLKTDLMLTDAQVTGIAPLLEAVSRAQQGIAPLQAAATQARTDAQAKISAILTEAQRPLLALVFPPAGGRGAGAPGGQRGGGPAVRIEPLADAVEVELTPPLDKEQGNFKNKPKTTWGDVPAIEVKEGTPRGRLIAFTAPPTLAAAAALAIAPAAAPAVAPADAPVGGRGGRGGGDRACWVYIPAGYKEGDVLPFMVDHDGSATAVVQTQLIAAMDILIAEKKIPMMAAVFIANGDSIVRGMRSRDYDTVSGVYADYIEKVVLPLAEKTGNVKLSQNSDARGAIGQSSGSPAAFGMAWFHTPAFNRIISYSGSFTSLQTNPTYPNGAQAYQETLIPNSEKKPIRIWMEVGSNDLTNNGDWRIQNNAFANALKAKGYSYQFLWSEGAGHVERGVERQTMSEAMEWVWKTYKAK